SADELGFGYEYVKPRNMAFMVTNVHCRFYKPVPLGERAQIVTWPLPPSYVTFGREYQIFSPSGDKYMDASSRWCLVDVETGKLLQAKMIEGQDYSTYNTERALDVASWKIPAFSYEEGKMCFEMTVRNSEYDHNMHVNNTRYADYCFNCFTLAELKERCLRSFAITYVRQCHENDVLRFFKKDCENESYLVQGMNMKNEIVVQAMIEFEKKD
ncbi:MAG: hypothetical protein IJX18_04130, partial [Clostridia bacterium]|nr:hypothetical protein [Clostridia bacterium]